MSVHLRLPLTLAGDGSFRTLPEDSIEEIVQSVAVVLRTRPGERLADPEVGTADPTFVGFDATVALVQVERWEDRATVELIEQAITSEGVQTSRLSVAKED